MRKRALQGAAAGDSLVKVAAGFLVGGLFLFLHVWIPVQAERSLIELRRVETELSRRKSELDDLDSRFAALTTLPALDQWAKEHGPWVAPNGENVIAIED